MTECEMRRAASFLYFLFPFKSSKCLLILAINRKRHMPNIQTKRQILFGSRRNFPHQKFKCIFPRFFYDKPIAFCSSRRVKLKCWQRHRIEIPRRFAPNSGNFLKKCDTCEECDGCDTRPHSRAASQLCQKEQQVAHKSAARCLLQARR